MSSRGKSRIAINKGGFQSPARSGFGGFSTASSSLSYISEPPDFSQISDPNVVVSLKNLLKKDSVTKAKALDDLLAYVQEHPYEQDGGVEEPVLDAWVKLYPRTSIDNSRRVRELSHMVQFELMKSARKRMERRIPKLAGSWLAGTFDKDRVVSRAANTGLSSFLTTEEKATQFWKKLQGQIMGYALETVKETPDSLSDERSTTKEDAQAKYYRVVGAALSLALNMLEKVGIDDVREQFDEFLGTEAVWALAAADDAWVRRSVYQLAQACLERQRQLFEAHLQQVGRALVSDALKVKQTGSAPDYVRVLTKLSMLHPEVWGTKRHPLSRLQPFVEKGSQSSGPAFWQGLYQLISAVTQESIPFELASSFLTALRTGLSGREEPRAHAPQSWGCYVDVFLLFLSRLTPGTSRPDLVKNHFYPLTEQYLHPVPERASWSIATEPEGPLLTAWTAVALYSDEAVQLSIEQEWQRLAESFTSRMANSLPEVSKDFHVSQQSIADEAERFFSIAGALLRRVSDADSDSERTEHLRDTLDTAANKVIQEALELLRKRNFKPFGAATAIAAAARYWTPFVEGEKHSVVSSLFSQDRPYELQVLLASPSATRLLSCLHWIYAGYPDRYAKIWTLVVDKLLGGETRDGHETAGISQNLSKMLEIMPAGSEPLAQEHEALQEYLARNVVGALKSENASTALLEMAVKRKAVAPSGFDRMAHEIVAVLPSVGDSAATALHALQLVMSHKIDLAENEAFQKQLVFNILELKDSSNDATLAQAEVTLSKVKATYLANVLQENLEAAHQNSLKIETVAEQAKSLLHARRGTSIQSPEASTVPLEDFLPNTNVWMEELALLLQDSPDPSLSLTSSLGGAYYLIKPSTGTMGRRARRDGHGYAIPTRMALYTTELLASGEVSLSSLPPRFQAELLYCLLLVVGLAEDQLISSFASKDSRLWVDLGRSSTSGNVEQLVFKARSVLKDFAGAVAPWEVGAKGELEGSFSGEVRGAGAELLTILLHQAKGLSPLSLYSAKALADVLEYFATAQMVVSIPKVTLSALNVWKATPDTILIAAALMAGLGERLQGPGESLDESSVVGLLCNRLVSDITGASPGENALMILVLLNTCFNVFGSDRRVPVNERRQIFAMKQITSWMGAPEGIDNRLSAEMCKALHTFDQTASPGQDSEVVIDYCISLWDGEDIPNILPSLHASLKLIMAMEAMPAKFPDRNNDDLVDALNTQAEAVSLGLLQLLRLCGDASRSGHSQPLEIVEDLLCRRVAKIPLKHVKDLSELYGYVASESKKIQTAAYSLLHMALPAKISQVNIDVLLEKQDAQLPDELLSLLVDAPTYDAFSDDALAQFPPSVRSYLLSWLLVFDAFKAASLKVRNDFTANLKSNKCLDPLMSFMFDMLGHSVDRPLNLERAKLDEQHIRSYNEEEAATETPERDMQWLLVHVFYLVLKYVPSLFKTWFLDCPSKPIKLAVEPWMTKYFSPLIIDETLSDVKQWADEQAPPEDDEKELNVTIWNKGREILAGYEVDEQDATMCIKIPAGYPLESVTVTTRNRVAISENKWQSWLMIIQGVITFNGSIIDGLAAFRRNMVGALKGQTECAICYSIISTDNKMPDKRCGTCKNLFHRVCLYKWFQTSSQNTCPLCRNPIDYLGASTQGRAGRAED